LKKTAQKEAQKESAVSSVAPAAMPGTAGSVKGKALRAAPRPFTSGSANNSALHLIAAEYSLQQRITAHRIPAVIRCDALQYFIIGCLLSEAG
jgi:hypothetical protein